jgi:hypothetical protein
VHLRVSSDQQTIERANELPPAGQERNYFFDLAQLGQVIGAELLDDDDQPADDRAWLVREKSWPRVETRAALSPELRRMAEVYQRNRPPGPGSKLVLITTSPEQLPSDSPGVVLAPVDESQTVSGSLNVAGHPVTREVNWQAVVTHARTSAAAPGGFRPVVSVGNHVLVAVRDGPVRQVWVGFDGPAWSASVDFVVFWANVLSWVGEGEESYASHPLSDFQADWRRVETPKVKPEPAAGQWPGIYEAPDGSKIALNAPAIPSRAVSADGQIQKLAGMLGSHESHQSSISTLLLVIAIGVIGAACWVWRSDMVRRDRLSGVA